MAGKYGSSFQVSATPVTVMAHFLGISALTLMLVWLLHFRGGLALNSNNQQLVFNVHPFLMLLGMIFLGGQAIMAYKTLPGTRKAQKSVHLALHLLALAVGVLGLCAVFKYHKDSNIPDLYTLHSWLGLGTICLHALQWVIGFLYFWYPGAAKNRKANLVPWHGFVGVVIFLMAVCTAELGLMEKFGFLHLVHGSEALLVNFTGLAILLFGIAVGLSVILSRP